MYMLKYVIKRVLLMILTLFVIMTMCFVLVKMLPFQLPLQKSQAQATLLKMQAYGYLTVTDIVALEYEINPIGEQYVNYIKNIFTNKEAPWGYSWKIKTGEPVNDLIIDRMPPTIILNVYSLIMSVPLGIGLGIYAALKKNKWQDHVVSTLVMVFVSVPSYVYAFLVQYLLFFKWGLFDSAVIDSLAEAGGWFTWSMFKSMLMPILSLSFGTIAGLARFTRAELTEVLTSEFMLLARTKGLTKGQATVRHALNNAMVPILPTIISMFINILSGSLIIETIFSVPGIGKVYIQSINQLDYDLFMGLTMFYTVIGLTAQILVDLSYGFIDPRIRMGAR
ncbi:MAG: ABC transporter permease [Clostridia bacterium]|nr:ABC transporter permease [Clostridia bacterium]